MSEELRVTHRRYVSQADAHYGGGIAAGAFVLGLFGDVATELCVLRDGDEGLLAGYREVRFLAPIRAGDIIEVSARLLAVGRRSRQLDFQAVVVARSAPQRGESAAAALPEPLLVAVAGGTVVVPG
jgi:3-aminobutyryl-CoA ammonia-lyase